MDMEDLKSWQFWAFCGMVAVWIPFFYLVATGKLNKARKVTLTDQQKADLASKKAP